MPPPVWQIPLGEPPQVAAMGRHVHGFVPCDRYRLDDEEKARLRKLFGDFASRHELLMNAQRKPVFR